MNQVDAPGAIIPPHNLDAERAVLGGVLYDAESLPAVRILQVTDFYTEAHRTIFTHILRVADSGRPVDLITVQQSLVDREELAAIGGPAMLALVGEAGALVIPAHMSTYVEMVRDQATKREAGAEFRRLGTHADNGSDPVALIDETRALLGRLEARGGADNLEPAVERIGDEFTVTFDRLGVRLEFTRTTLGDGARADVRVLLRDRVLDWGNLALSSTTARVSRASKLTKTVGGVPWVALLDVACDRVAHMLRSGEPAVVLVPAASEGPGYFIEPVMPLGQPTVIHGDGGAFKSGLAMALGLAGYHGISLPGLGAPAVTGPCLYLDFETDQPTAERRAYLLARGLGVSGEGAIIYQHMTGPLVDELSSRVVD